MEALINKNVTVLNHPLIKHNLSIIRDKNSDTEKFKNALKRITYALLYEATSSLPTQKITVETPLMETTCEVFDKEAQYIIAPILRAGLIFCEIAQELLPFANVHHIGMYRDEKTLEPVWYYDKRKEIKKDKSKVFVLILDPMLAYSYETSGYSENFGGKGGRHCPRLHRAGVPESGKSAARRRREPAGGGCPRSGLSGGGDVHSGGVL